MTSEHMQVELKLVLASKQDAETVRSALQAGLIRHEQQENHFFDTPSATLYNQGSVLRVRITTSSQGNVSANVALKEHNTVDSGSQVVWSAQENISPEVASQLHRNPDAAFSDARIVPVIAPLLHQLLESAAPGTVMRFVDSFHNFRQEYAWAGCKSQSNLVIRVDETTYPFGVRFEVEVTGITVPVSDVLQELVDVLNGLGVNFTLGKESKFHFFVQNAFSTRASSHMVQDVKLVLSSESDILKVAQQLSSGFVRDDDQENFFFDGSNGELSQQQAYFRVRSTDQHRKVVGVLKEHQDNTGGTQLCWAREISIDPDCTRMLLTNPRDSIAVSQFLQSSNPMALVLRENFPTLQSLRFVGSFKTYRRTYQWVSKAQPIGLMLKLDKTVFPFGVHFELEVTEVNVPVHDVLEELQDWMRELQVGFNVGTQSKLETFLLGCSKSFMNAHNIVV